MESNPNRTVSAASCSYHRYQNILQYIGFSNPYSPVYAILQNQHALATSDTIQVRHQSNMNYILKKCDFEIEFQK